MHTTLSHNPKGDILIVDDALPNLQVLSGVLGEQGYEVRRAPNGSTALMTAKAEPPDLILLDIRMPDMDGYEVCQKLKADKRTRDIPVIFISAMTETFDKVRGFRLGAVDYVTKPFETEELLARVRTHVTISRLQKDLRASNRILQNTLDELRFVQSQLVRSEKMASLGVLTAGIAHEINNPVTFISSGIEGLKEILNDYTEVIQHYDDITPENAVEKLAETERIKKEVGYHELQTGIKELICNISTGVRRTADIVKSLRTFSRMDEGEKRYADIHENLDSTLLLLRNQYKDSITITKKYGEIPRILCYPAKLNQVFMNILVNAIDSVRSVAEPAKKAEIIIRTLCTEKQGRPFVVTEIEDTGTGIPEEIRHRLFEPFFSTKDVGKGTGLGLSISLGIMQNHEGTIEVRNTPGQGAVFCIYLPYRKEKP